MSEEIVIETIEQRGPVEKTGKSWRLPITYVLGNGQRIDTGRAFNLKRDAVAFAAGLPAAPDYPTSATFREGRYIGTRTTFYSGWAAAMKRAEMEEWEGVVDAIDHMLSTHEEFDHLHHALKVAQSAVFYVRDHGIVLEVRGKARSEP